MLMIAPPQGWKVGPAGFKPPAVVRKRRKASVKTKKYGPWV